MPRCLFGDQSTNHHRLIAIKRARSKSMLDFSHDSKNGLMNVGI